jgi:protein O-mannosyl-transferase
VKRSHKHQLSRPASAVGSPLPGEKAKPWQVGGFYPRSARPWTLGLLLIAATFLAYLRIWHAGFIWDDDFYVTENATLRNLTGLWQVWTKIGVVPQYYPLVHTTFWLEYHLWGLHPLGYHLDNVLLHALAAILLGCGLRSLQVPGAWLAAAIFAVHPVQVESVAWVTERKNVLSALFYFAAALAYLHFDPPGHVEVARQRRWRFYFLALILFVAALLSKTVTCTLPAALLLVRWWKHQRLRAGDILPLLPFFVIGASLGLLTALVERYHVGANGPEWSLTFADRCLVAGRALWFYAGKLAWPEQLTFIYPRWHINAGIWWQWAFPFAAGGVVTTLWFLRGRIGCGPLVGVLFFAGTLGPALGFVNVYPMRFSFVADHFQYLASSGIIALVGAGIAQLLARFRLWQRPAGDALCAALLLALATMTGRQCGMYADLETLWRATIARNPDCPMAHTNLGNMLTRQGRLVEAVQHLSRVIQLNPDDAEAHCNLGGALAAQKKWPEAIQQCEQALKLDPNKAKAHCNLGVALAAQGKFAEATQHFERALQLDPNYAEPLNDLGVALARQGKLDEAIKSYERALQLDPDYVDAHFDLGNTLVRQGKLDEAVQHYERALQLKPDLVQARINLGVALAVQRRLNEAMQQFQQALNLATAQGNTALAESIRTRIRSYPPTLLPPQTP